MGHPDSPLGPAHKSPGGSERRFTERFSPGEEAEVRERPSDPTPGGRPRPVLKLFSTCPPYGEASLNRYAQQVAEVSRWSEEAGYAGILVYTDNSMVDSWLVAQVIIQNTQSLCPLVAVQPAYIHPYTAAKMVTSLGNMYRRRLCLNMVAGGFKSDLIALNDTIPHDRRYHRLAEYTAIIKGLLAGSAPVTFDGEFYKVNNLKLSPPLPVHLFPGIFVSGSSAAGLEAARTLGATAIQYPHPASDNADHPPPDGISCGIRVGIIARESEGEAWTAAHRRFPEDRQGQITHQLVMKVSDSSWHQELSNLIPETQVRQGPYWLTPFANYKTFCPYLVGSYPTVARELAKYMSLGYETFILDVPPGREELAHTNTAFSLALGEVEQ